MRSRSGRWRKAEGSSSSTGQSQPERTCPRAGDRPSRRRFAGIAARNPPWNRPRSRPAGRGSWAHIRPGLPPSPVRARAAAGALRRPAEQEGSRGTAGSRRYGGLLSCIGRRSGSGRRGRRGSRRGRGLLRGRGCRCGRRRGCGFLRDRRRSGRRRPNRWGSDSCWAWRYGGCDIRPVARGPEEGRDRDEDDAPEQSP